MSGDASFPWAEQAVCVTGARGRLGTRIVPALVERGAKVVAFDRTPGASPGKDVRARAGDLLRPGDLDRALRGCTLVFHLAAKASADGSFAEPESYLDTNATGTFALLAACQRNQVKRVVFASTGLVYGRPQALPVDESHAAQPLSPYAASKLAAEAGLAAYAQALGFSVDSARFSNLYGAEDRADTVVGSALGCALRGEPIGLRDLRPVRDFLHVDDAVEALLRLAQAGQEPGLRVYNVSTGQGESVGRMAQLLAEAVTAEGGPELEVRQEGDPGESSSYDLVLDCSALAARTGWRPGIALGEGLRRVYRGRRAG